MIKLTDPSIQFIKRLGWQTQFRFAFLISVMGGEVNILHTSPEKFENATITGHFGLSCASGKLGQGNNIDIFWITSSFSKTPFFQNVCFPPHQNSTLEFPNPSGLKNVFEMDYCGGPAEIKLRFQISPRVGAHRALDSVFNQLKLPFINWETWTRKKVCEAF